MALCDFYICKDSSQVIKRNNIIGTKMSNSGPSDKDFASHEMSDLKLSNKSDIIINDSIANNEGDAEYYEKTFANSDDYNYESKGSSWRRFKDSFKRADRINQDVLGSADLELNPSHSLVAENANLKQNIKGRHVLMMSLATGIGTGLLVGNGKTLYTGGPAGLTMVMPSWVHVCTVLSKLLVRWLLHTQL